MECWSIQLFGGLTARRATRTVDRFRTRKGGEILAALALRSGRPMPRGELVLLLWPEQEPAAGRNRLRVELAALRWLFAEPDPAFAPLIQADRLIVWLAPDAFTTDVDRFTRSLTLGTDAADRAEQIRLLTEAVYAYSGDLLPGCDAVWVVSERERLAALHQEALRRLIRRLAHERDFDRAITCAQRALEFDPWNEEAHADLVRLLLAVGQPTAAIRQYGALEGMLWEQFSARPTAALRALIEQVRERGQQPAALRADWGSAPAAPPCAPKPPPSKLPAHRNRFFGREAEQIRLTTLLFASRLVTVTGPGGIGKTRLAVETADRLPAQFPGGVRFVYLGEVRDAGEALEALRQALSLPARAGRSAVDQIGEALSPNPSLLILDNAERLKENGGALAEALLASAPALTLLVTSRRALGVDGEREFPLAPLPTPTVGAGAADFASVRLFVDRAQAVRPDYELTSRNARAIVHLCAYLEGIPLALELAAGRIRTLTPGQMSQGLVPRLDLLVNPHTDQNARHRSLRSAIGWSARLLSPDTFAGFARLAMFRDGFDLGAAAHLCQTEPGGAGGAAPGDANIGTVDPLERLLSESLLVAEEVNGGMRYRMLESVREFAWEQLPSGEAGAVRRSQMSWMRNLAAVAQTALDGPEQREWLDRLEAERSNLWAALTWCSEAPESAHSPQPVEIGLQIIGDLRRFWELRGGVSEARHHAENLLARAGAGIDATVLARPWNAAGTLAQNQTDYPAAPAIPNEIEDGFAAAV